MTLSSLLTVGQIIPEMKATERWPAITEIVDLLVSTQRIEPQYRDSVLAALKQREETMSTGIGFGIAIPHAEHELRGGIAGRRRHHRRVRGHATIMPWEHRPRRESTSGVVRSYGSRRYASGHEAPPAQRPEGLGEPQGCTGHGWRCSRVMERRRIELPTSALRTPRSPS